MCISPRFPTGSMLSLTSSNFLDCYCLPPDTPFDGAVSHFKPVHPHKFEVIIGEVWRQRRIIKLVRAVYPYPVGAGLDGLPGAVRKCFQYGVMVAGVNFPQ